jgi:hypothetical protein
MNPNIINELLSRFSDEKGFVYQKKPIPYRPFGEVTGLISETNFKFHIYRPEGKIGTTACAIFSLLNPNFIPKGFCIEHGYPLLTGNVLGGFSNRSFDKSKSFDEQISNLSYDEKVVTKFLDDEDRFFLIKIFEQINNAESTLFKARSCLRISDQCISITIGNIFDDIEQLNVVYSAVIEILFSIKERFLVKM